MSYKQQKRYNQENSSYSMNNAGGHPSQHYQQQPSQQYYQAPGKNSQHQPDYDAYGESQQSNQSYQKSGPHRDGYQQRPQTGYQSKGNHQKPTYNNQGSYQNQQYSQQNQQQQRGGYQDDYKKSYNPQQQQQQKYPSSQKQMVANPEPGAYNPFANKPTGGKPFNQRPQTSAVANRGGNTMAVNVAPGQTLALVSNQYKLKLGGSVQVFQYALEIVGMELWDANLVQKIVRFKRSALEKSLGLYVVSGSSIYMLTELEEDVKFEVSFSGAKYSIVIEQSTQSSVVLDGKFDNQDNTVAQNLINIIIKQAFRDTDLKQIGKTPRFFDMSNAQTLEHCKLKIMSGFKASVFQSQVGPTLVVDSIFKFMSTYSCLERIRDIGNDQRLQKHEFEARCRNEFVDSSIIANWGNQRQYIVSDIIFDSNPVKMFFEHNGEKVSIAQYFLQTYKLRISDPSQPLFKVNVAQRDFYLPTELCLIDGVPESVRKGAGMRDALAHTRIDPSEKLKRIHGMVKTLFNQKAVKDWSIEVEAEPVGVTTQILNAPQMISNKQIMKCDDNSLRKGTIHKPQDLLKERWIMIYENNERVFRVADDIYNNMCKASKQLGLKIEEPYWIELSKETNRQELDNEIRNYISGSGQFRHPTIVLCVLQRESTYEMFKEVMLRYEIPSQVVTFRNGNKFNLSKATNILRQINSKAGGDLYHLQFPEVLSKKRTMLIGIDVCHAGPKSIVGFSASTNKEMCQYYSDYFVQSKGKEIVHDKMKESLMAAIRAFSEKHENEFPTNFVIYRDGVGDAQQNQVLSTEIPQFEAAINAMYNKASYKPEITVVVVNKRISQRFFVKDSRGNMSNPPPGCIIDKQLCQDYGKESSRFDFFMTPAACTQGCVLPTHFYVPKNDSCLKRADIHQLTYALCYYYFNWAGSIKVPAPVQYAHKIAEFYTNINAHKKKKDIQTCGQEALMLRKTIEQRVMPINNRLHFL